MNKKIKIIISLVLVFGFSFLVFILAQSKRQTVKSNGVGDVVVSDQAASTSSSKKINTENAPAGDVPKALKYKDGKYSVTSSYDSPAGMEDFSMSVTMKDDIVSDSVFAPMANDGKSQRYQNGFAKNFKSFVVGKNIDSLNLDVVSGASLTSEAFNSALAQIRTKAQI